MLLLLGGAGSSPAGLVGYTFAAFVLTTIVLEFVRGTRARKAIGSGGWWSAFSGLVARNRRRYGGYVVHAVIVLLLIGAIGIGGFSTTREARLAPGESVTAATTASSTRGARSARRERAGGARAARRLPRRRQVGTMEAGKNSYFAEEQTSNEVGIRTDWLRGRISS